MGVLVVLLFVAVTTAELAPLFENAEPISGKYIIKIKDEYNVDDAVATLRSSNVRVGTIFRHALHGFTADISDQLLDIVRKLPAVQYVEQDGMYRTKLTWHLDRIDQRDLPRDQTYTPSGTGSGYTVWVIDSGICDTHPEFEGRAQQVVSFAEGTNEDCGAHGTKMAGYIGSVTYGVVPGVQLKGVKVANCFGTSSTSIVISGIDYVIANAGARSVAFLGVGGDVSSSLDTAVDNLVGSGVPCTVPAGNDDKDACLSSPARASAATCVGATDSNDKRYPMSNYGSCVDILAPGMYVSSFNCDYLVTSSGTSHSAAIAAGALVLYDGSVSSMIANASTNKVSDAMGSPNLLVYV